MGLKIAFVALRVGSVNQMVDFYTDVIGLSLIGKTERKAYLGIPKQHKLFLILSQVARPSQKSVNLKSFSLVFPNRISFKKTLARINNLGIKFTQVTSNRDAIFFYLKDPEGNRVVLSFFNSDFNSKDQLAWLTLPVKKLSARRYLQNFNQESRQVSSQTIFGWLDLSVTDLHRSLTFYRQLFKLDCRISADHKRAVLFDRRNHQFWLFLNQANGRVNYDPNGRGLDYYDVKMADDDEIDRVLTCLKRYQIDFQYSQANHFIFVSDPDQVNIVFSLL